MATYDFAAIYDAEEFAVGINEAQLELNAFIRAGIAVQDTRIQAQLGDHSTNVTLSGYAPLGTDEPNKSNDNPADESVPLAVGTQQMTARTFFHNQSWSVMDLAEEIALNKDPAGYIISKLGQYWATINQRYIISTITGVLADNDAADSGDMIVDITADNLDPVADAERISGAAIIDTAGTMGDKAGRLTGLAVHSQVYRQMQKQELIDFIPTGVSNIKIARYMNEYNVVVDDSLPVVAGTVNPAKFAYTCYLFGSGIIRTADRMPMNPSEIWRNPNAGKGGGEERLFSRRTDAFHPLGFTYLGAVESDTSPTRPDLEDAANWNRVWERENIPLAALKVNV